MPKPKYDYLGTSAPRITNVEAPDFRESKAFAVYVDAVKAIIYATEGITSRAVKAELGELNNDTWTAEALDMLCASEHVASIGVQWVRYIRSSPSTRKVEAVDSVKVNEFKQHQRDRYGSYPTVGNYFFGA